MSAPLRNILFALLIEWQLLAYHLKPSFRQIQWRIAVTMIHTDPTVRSTHLFINQGFILGHLGLDLADDEAT